MEHPGERINLRVSKAYYSCLSIPETRKPYNVENEKFYNPKITKVDISSGR